MVNSCAPSLEPPALRSDIRRSFSCADKEATLSKSPTESVWTTPSHQMCGSRGVLNGSKAFLFGPKHHSDHQKHASQLKWETKAPATT